MAEPLILAHDVGTSGVKSAGRRAGWRAARIGVDAARDVLRPRRRRRAGPGGLVDGRLPEHARARRALPRPAGGPCRHRGGWPDAGLPARRLGRRAAPAEHDPLGRPRHPRGRLHRPRSGLPCQRQRRRRPLAAGQDAMAQGPRAGRLPPRGPLPAGQGLGGRPHDGRVRLDRPLRRGARRLARRAHARRGGGPAGGPGPGGRQAAACPTGPRKWWGGWAMRPRGQMGLRAGVPVVAGAGDGCCATAGAGAVRPGDTYCCLGTTAWVATVAEGPTIDPQARVFNLPSLDGAGCGVYGTVQSAGRAVDWVMELLGEERPRPARRAAGRGAAGLRRARLPALPGGRAYADLGRPRARRLLRHRADARARALRAGRGGGRLVRAALGRSTCCARRRRSRPCG